MRGIAKSYVKKKIGHIYNVKCFPLNSMEFEQIKKQLQCSQQRAALRLNEDVCETNAHFKQASVKQYLCFALLPT